MGRLYTHNNLKDAKEQFDIMFINNVNLVFNYN